MKQKRFWISSLAMALALVVCVGFAGCGKKQNKKTSNAQTGVVSNGGMVVQKGDWIYFVGGYDAATTPNKNVTNSAIWCGRVDQNGNFVQAPTVFVDSIVGFEHGSIHIFGDYLYYVTPSTSKNSAGETLSGILEFYRKPLAGGKVEKLYATSSSEEDEAQYAYYPMGENDLYLLVFEKDAKTLVSVDIGSKPKATTLADNVTGVVFAEGGATDGANRFVFYTHAKDKNDADRTGNVVERILPNGQEKTAISGKSMTYSLLAIRSGELLYAENDIIYKSSGEATLSRSDVVVSYRATSAYEDMVMFADHIIVRDANDNIIYISWQGNQMTEYKIANSKDAAFLAVENGKLFFIDKDSYLCAVNIEEDAEVLKLCDQKVQKPAGDLMPEIVGGKLYFMHQDAEGKVVLFRADTTVSETTDAVKVAA